MCRGVASSTGVPNTTSTNPRCTTPATASGVSSTIQAMRTSPNSPASPTGQRRRARPSGSRATAASTNARSAASSWTTWCPETAFRLSCAWQAASAVEQSCCATAATSPATPASVKSTAVTVAAGPRSRRASSIPAAAVATDRLAMPAIMIHGCRAGTAASALMNSRTWL